MPGVEVLDESGAPMLIDRFRWDQRYQSMQLLQRGVRWKILRGILTGRFRIEVAHAAVQRVGDGI